MTESHPEDPLEQLSKKALRRMARKYKIKHFYRKSPSSLKRAIRRAQKYRSKKESRQEETAIKAPLIESVTPVLKTEEKYQQRREAEQKAFQEHRSRYLFAPSKFVHKGTHEEYLLEKDEDIELPDFYQEDELVALSVDPNRFYVYWDFSEETLFDVRSWLSEENRFVLRIYDVTSLVFDGSNAHNSWETSCHPLVREWYLNAPVDGRDLLVELGVVLKTGFRRILRSNMLSIPPASVSPITHDVFAQFIPYEAAELDDLDPLMESPLLDITHAEPAASFTPRPETSAHLFFQEYVPSPMQFNPPPPPKTILQRDVHFLPQADESRSHPPQTVSFKPAIPKQASHLEPAPPQIADIPVLSKPELSHSAPQVERQDPLYGHHEWTEQDVLGYLDQGGSRTLQEWLGLPHEIRWLSDLPNGMSPVFFESWVEDPYDRAVMISYAIWPWDLTEYIPLGASDWTLRKFLGASLFSWYTPGGSERVRWWQQPVGGSEKSKWLQPLGASEFSWSGSQQAGERPHQSAWHLWPVSPSGRGNLSGAGKFGV